MQQFLVIFSLIAFTNAVPVIQANTQNKDSSKQIQTQKQQQQQQQPIYNQNDQMLATSHHDKDQQYAGSSILENPAYDPNLFSSFIPQDAIQQYVNQFGGPYAPYTPNVFPPPAPYAVQTGYEGYIVPEIQTSIVTEPSLYTGPLQFLRGIVPKFMVAWLIKSATIILSTFGMVFFGGIITTAVCTLTPLCSITFNALPALRWQQSSVTTAAAKTAEAMGKQIGIEITPERLRRAAQFVQTAIDKYTKLQDTNVVQNDPKNKNK